MSLPYDTLSRLCFRVKSVLSFFSPPGYNRHYQPVGNLSRCPASAKWTSVTAHDSPENTVNYCSYYLFRYYAKYCRLFNYTATTVLGIRPVHTTGVVLTTRPKHTRNDPDERLTRKSSRDYNGGLWSRGALKSTRENDFAIPFRLCARAHGRNGRYGKSLDYVNKRLCTDGNYIFSPPFSDPLLRRINF